MKNNRMILGGLLTAIFCFLGFTNHITAYASEEGLSDEAYELINWAEEMGIELSIEEELLDNPSLLDDIPIIDFETVEEAKQFLLETKDGFILEIDDSKTQIEENLITPMITSRSTGIYDYRNWVTTRTGFNVNTNVGAYWIGGLQVSVRSNWRLNDSTGVRTFTSSNSITSTQTGWDPARVWSQNDSWHTFLNNNRSARIDVRGSLRLGVSIAGIPISTIVTRAGSFNFTITPGQHN